MYCTLLIYCPIWMIFTLLMYCTVIMYYTALICNVRMYCTVITYCTVVMYFTVLMYCTVLIYYTRWCRVPKTGDIWFWMLSGRERIRTKVSSLLFRLCSSLIFKIWEIKIVELFYSFNPKITSLPWFYGELFFKNTHTTGLYINE